ncbi:alpha-D-ribose 1-methylphosphonate 5-triphosphate diphosphatase [Poseidonocella sedimentorum]|uniref:Alpha-D-ribose 1-methylphosphonate 5-triphosphate diphosphatase n=1 Tax=Poseidonocella sedimentorum TaxID=871652 RepID=A0A1I6CT48_9RHOB|nr:alpha-D-ribose 1-methylphosphonate 5-triphosphate diphosphatase [Poseidonocella sedimentorum]SFQ96378.1 alpha-D-ribose 1-methylphosphonate 5-triphosphate diphosphatase [Poseidonocella sedimentorum]
MSLPPLHITRARVLRPEGWTDAPLGLAGGVLTAAAVGRAIDLSGYLVLPGIVDIHGDGFERHVARRRGAMMDMEEGLLSAAAELAVNGITTAMLAQFYSWEGGLRSPDFARAVIDAHARARAIAIPDLHLQLRVETHMLDDYPEILRLVRDHAIRQVVFNDHLPHDRLAAGRTIPRLTGTALKSRRSPEAHLALMQALHARRDEVPEAVSALARDLAGAGAIVGHHDAQRAEDVAFWARAGVSLAEFPETQAAAEAARAQGGAIVLGAPNVNRGGSHKGNASATELVGQGLCDALASDYHYPAPRRAVLQLAARGILPLEAAWPLISSGPAAILGFADRGRLAAGLRADLVVLDAATHQVAATISGGRLAYMAGEVAARFVA